MLPRKTPSATRPRPVSSGWWCPRCLRARFDFRTRAGDFGRTIDLRFLRAMGSGSPPAGRLLPRHNSGTFWRLSATKGGMIDRLDPVRTSQIVEVEPLTDHADTVRRAQRGSEDAFEQLVRSFGPRLHRSLAVRLGDDRDARDALQETLIAAWQGLPGLRHVDRFWPWLA